MKPDRLIAIFFLGVTVIFMCLTFAGVARRAAEKLEVPQKTFSEDSPKTVNINWEKLYPFDNDDSTVPIRIPIRKKSIFFYINNIKAKIEAYTSEKIAGSYLVIDTAKKYEELIGWNIASVYEYNGVTKLHDGYLTGISSKSDISSNANATINLAAYCKSKGIDFFYVNAPHKICVYEDKDIYGILDFTNQNADEFLRLLNEAGVRNYDFRKILHAEGMKHHEAFFRTDHHWKPETGLWAAKHILEFLRDDFGWNVEPEILNPDRFAYKVYPEWFLGSQGKKVTHMRTKPDDFTMIYPKFETKLHYEIPSLGINTSGDFTVTYDMTQVEVKDYYNKSTYAAYNHARKPLTRLDNILADNNKKIMLIYDSFFNVVNPFLALSIKQVITLDIRQFTGSIKKVIEANHPDLVAVMYYAQMTNEGLDLAAHISPYDFR